MARGRCCFLEACKSYDMLRSLVAPVIEASMLLKSDGGLPRDLRALNLYKDVKE